MTCCPLQDMDNTYQSSLQMWLPAPEQVNEASKHFTSAWTNWTQWVTKHSRGKGEKEMLEFGGKGEQRMEQGAQDQDDAYMYETVKE